jgi:hypothetical protein
VGLKNGLIGYKNFSFYDFYIPLFRYFGKYKILYQSFLNLIYRYKKKPKNFKGFLPFDGNWNDDFDNLRKMQDKYQINLSIDNINKFNDYISFCKNNKINVILVNSPEYIEGQMFMANRKQYIDIFNDLSKKYNIPFLNYSSDSICYKRDLFYNTSHLNSIGAEIFSKKLAHDLKSIINPVK